MAKASVNARQAAAISRRGDTLPVVLLTMGTRRHNGTKLLEEKGLIAAAFDACTSTFLDTVRHGSVRRKRKNLL